MDDLSYSSPLLIDSYVYIVIINKLKLKVKSQQLAVNMHNRLCTSSLKSQGRYNKLWP